LCKITQVNIEKKSLVAQPPEDRPYLSWYGKGCPPLEKKNPREGRNGSNQSCFMGCTRLTTRGRGGGTEKKRKGRRAASI